VSARRALVLILFLFAAVAAVGEGQSDGREVVQASEILEKIERGEPINYTYTKLSTGIGDEKIIITG
jgi:hypothetical protein